MKTTLDPGIQRYIESVLVLYSLDSYPLTFLLNRVLRGINQDNPFHKLHPKKRVHTKHIINNVLYKQIENHPLRKQIVILVLTECVQENSYQPAITRLKEVILTRKIT